MRFSVSALSSLLLVGVAFAAPSSRLEQRLARRAAARGEAGFSHLSHPLKPEDSTGITPDVGGLNATHVQYSGNPPSGATFASASGRFKVPTPSAPSGGSGSYSASAWVGIDGDTYGKAILQSGIDFTVGSAGKVTYDAWYEWYPDYAYDFSSFDMSAGDEIAVSIKSSGASAGVVALDNLTTGKKVSKSLSAPSKKSHLGGKNAEWIVEDFESGSSEVAFADFGEVTFTKCVAHAGGKAVGLKNEHAITIDIKQSGTVLTDATIVSASELTVKYAG